MRPTWTLIALLAISSEARAETILVLPYASEGRPLGDMGDATLLRTLGALRAMGDLNLVHPKQLNRVLEHYEHTMAEATDLERRDALMTVFGADRVLYGGIAVQKEKLKITLAISKLKNRGKKTFTLEGPDLIATLDQLPKQLEGLLKKAKVKTGKLTGEVTPKTSSEEALLKYAACHRRLIEQPIGIRYPVVLDKDNLDQVIELCAEALKLDPKLADAHAALGFAYALKGDQENAERALGTIKDHAAFLPLYWIGKYWTLSRFHHPDLAIKTLGQAIERNPGFLLARGYLGDTYAALRRYDESMKVFEAYRKAVPKQPWVMGRLGYISAKRKDLKGAISWTKKALRVAPTDSELLLEMASRYVDAKDWKKAVVILRRLIGEGAARGEVHLRLGYAYLNMGQLGDAEKQLRVAIKKATRSSEWRTRGRARYDLAKLWAQSGLVDNALSQLQLAVEEGFRDRKVFERDKDFVALLKDPRFKKILDHKIESIGVPTHASPFKLNVEAASIDLGLIPRVTKKETVLFRF